ncbi:diguanylate cyclase [Clostridium sp. 19966]|uniref:diguanylate cyclase domain-containing protein n=1 Tax=Clostridium sp. 19966 TaxID=2768166 RepID=UPI0028DE25E9|nr:diguanylate cyclase [Clostridium sp. 19966]MDT8715984.1 diguanylate cyclase [Clostridium sp. 19966]
MDNLFLEKQLYKEKIKGLPNFFDFMKEDIKKIFGSKGKFIVCNIFNLTDINENYGIDIGDSCIRILIQAIAKIMSENDKICSFRFGANDFLIPLPSYLNIRDDYIKEQLEDQFKRGMINLGYKYFKINSLTIEYDKELESVEDFYFILINSLLAKSKEKEDIYNSERVIKHMIYNFMTNVRKSLSCYNDIRDLALTDDISGLPNHRSAKLYIQKLIEQYENTKLKFSLLFVDGDDLRRYNKISYESGNDMIRKLSEIIGNSIRTEDRVFRWLCGDEFLIVLSGMEKKEALEKANIIKEEVQKQTKDYIYPTTISIGISNYPLDGDSMEDIILKAEKANSAAKNKGKNKIIVWNNDIKVL